MTEIRGRTALVVGAASGMGRAIALTLASAGVNVHIADINEIRLADTHRDIEALGSDGIAVRCDVTDNASVASLVERVFASGPIDILVHTPGMAVAGPPDRIELSAWQQLLDRNVLGTVRIVNAFVPSMVAAHAGHIVITGSEAGFVPQSWGIGACAASKAAINAYAESLALYLRPNGVGTSLLCPGFVLSNFGEHASVSGAANPAPWFELGPNLRPIDPDEVGPVVVDAILADRFLVLTHPEFAATMTAHAADIDASLVERQTALRRPPDPTAVRSSPP